MYKALTYLRRNYSSLALEEGRGERDERTDIRGLLKLSLWVHFNYKNSQQATLTRLVH